MKKVLMIAIFMMMAVFLTATSSFSFGNKNATGQITSLDNGNSFNPFATVQGYTEGGSLWLGFSFKCGGGNWEDRDPKKVKGKFTETFTMSTCPEGYSAIRSCLWKGKDGGLMEGQVDCYDK